MQVISVRHRAEQDHGWLRRAPRNVHLEIAADEELARHDCGDRSEVFDQKEDVRQDFSERQEEKFLLRRDINTPPRGQSCLLSVPFSELGHVMCQSDGVLDLNQRSMYFHHLPSISDANLTIPNLSSSDHVSLVAR